MQNWGGGGRQIGCIMGDVQMAYVLKKTMMEKNCHVLGFLI